MCIYLEVSSQESLKEAALSTANIPKNVAVEDAALGLLLLQVQLLVSGHCRMETKAHRFQLLPLSKTLLIKLNQTEQTGNTRGLTFTHFAIFI